MLLFPLFDHVVVNSLTRQILVPMLDLIYSFPRQPMQSNRLDVLLAKLLQSQNHHIVVQARKLSSIVVRKRCACALFTLRRIGFSYFR